MLTISTHIAKGQAGILDLKVMTPLSPLIYSCDQEMNQKLEQLDKIQKIRDSWGFHSGMKDKTTYNKIAVSEG